MTTDIARWLRELEDPDSNIRASAARSLGSAGAAGRTAIPAIGRLLSDHERYPRQYAAEALARLGGKEAGDELARALPSAAGETRVFIAHALRAIGPDAVGHVPLVIEELRHRGPRIELAWALGSIGATGIHALLVALADSLPDADEALRDAASGLAHWHGGNGGPKPENPLPIWQVSAHAVDPREREAAVFGLSLFAYTRASEVIEPLTRALCDEEPRVRRAAAKGLSPAAKHAVTDLVRALTDRDEPTVLAATAALGGAGGLDAVEAISRALDDPRPAVRDLASRELGKLGQDAASFAPHLARVFASGVTPAERCSAAGALAALWSDVETARPDIAAVAREPALASARDPDPGVRCAAVALLGVIGEGSAELFAAALSAPETRQSAVRADGPGASAGALAALSAPDADTRVAAADALGRSALSPRAVEALVWAACDESPLVRRAAVAALAAATPAWTGAPDSARSATRALAAALEDAEEAVQIAAIRSLGLIGPSAVEHVDALGRFLSRPATRQGAAETLASIGRISPGAVLPLLVEEMRKEAARDPGYFENTDDPGPWNHREPLHATDAIVAIGKQAGPLLRSLAESDVDERVKAFVRAILQE